MFYRLLLGGGINPDDPHNPEDNCEHAGMVFFRDRVGPVLNKPLVKVSPVLPTKLLELLYIGSSPNKHLVKSEGMIKYVDTTSIYYFSFLLCSRYWYWLRSPHTLVLLAGV